MVQGTQLSVNVADLPPELAAALLTKVEELLSDKTLGELRRIAGADIGSAAVFLDVTRTQVWLVEGGRSSLEPKLHERLRRYYISKILERIAHQLRE